MQVKKLELYEYEVRSAIVSFTFVETIHFSLYNFIKIMPNKIIEASARLSTKYHK